MAVTTKLKSKSAPTPPKTKKFAEDAGLSHLLSLSQSIVQAKTQTHQNQIQHKKSQVAAIQQKKREEAHRRKEKSSLHPGANGAEAVKFKTKAEIKAQLKKGLREKTKLRKEARRNSNKAMAQHVAGVKAEENKAEKGKNKARKSVSFAFN